MRERKEKGRGEEERRGGGRKREGEGKEDRRGGNGYTMGQGARCQHFMVSNKVHVSTGQF